MLTSVNRFHASTLSATTANLAGVPSAGIASSVVTLMKPSPPPLALGQGVEIRPNAGTERHQTDERADKRTKKLDEAAPLPDRFRRVGLRRGHRFLSLADGFVDSGPGRFNLVFLLIIHLFVKGEKLTLGHLYSEKKIPPICAS